MGQINVSQPVRTYRGTWGEMLAHSSDIPQTSEVEVTVFEAPPLQESDPTLALLESWIALAPTDPEEILLAEEDLREFKRNMNQPRKEGGARLLYPEVE